jgi:c-di-GMP-binding flagellar brake protein YcgR
MESEEPATKHRYGFVNFERRKFPRFSVDMPVEYDRLDSFIPGGRTLNVSEGGLLIYFPERMETGHHLWLRLFFTNLGADLKSIEAVVEVVWSEIGPNSDLEEYRAGVKFVNISSEDLTTLKRFVASLAEPPYVLQKR